MTLRRIAKAITPPIFVDFARMIMRGGENVVSVPQRGPVQPESEPAWLLEYPLSHEESAELVERMDRGDYEFAPQTLDRMLAAWKIDPARVPYPTLLSEAYASGDALLMNSHAIMELSYKLPYSIAYEATQDAKYNAFVDFVEGAGLDFSGATVVDVGAGYGGLLNVIGRRFPDTRLIALEFAESALAYIRQNHSKVLTVKADLTVPQKELLGGAFDRPDIVLCTEVLEHLVRPDVAMGNILSLEPRRGIGLSVPNGRVDTASQHINYWSPESWPEFLRPYQEGWTLFANVCPSPGAPGGTDNAAVLMR